MISRRNLFQFYLEHLEQSLDNSVNSFDRLISCTTDIVQSLHDGKVKMEDWEVYIETLAIKIIFASKSIFSLTKGLKISSTRPGKEIEIIDRSSIYLLTRSVIEAFLTLEYLYFNDEKKDVKEFRYKLWKASGLLARQNIKLVGPPPPSITNEFKKQQKKHKKQQEEEKKMLDQLMLEIKSSPHYRNLSSRNKDKLEKYGLPRILTWNKLMKKSKLNTDFLQKMYSLCSNYAHSEYISAIQINELSPLSKDQIMIEGIKLAISITSTLNSAVIVLLKKRFKSAEIIFNALPEQQIDNISLWCHIGGMSNI